jgi:ankyrin repeat protein
MLPAPIKAGRTQMTSYATVEDVLRSVQNVVQFFDRPIKSLEDRGIFGDTPLIIAAGWGKSDAVRLLLDAGADVDATGEDHQTALHRAIESGVPEVVELLINSGARIDAKDDHGNTPMTLAAEAEDERIRELVRRIP